MKITLGERNRETVAIYFEKAARPEIRALLPQKAKTLEEALADYEQTLLPGAASFGRTIWADGRYVGDVWCYCMGQSAEPNGMVSCCVFETALWGKGVAGEALGLFLAELRTRFPWMGTVGAFAYAANRPSIRVLEKNGFALAERFVEDGAASEYHQLALSPPGGGN